MFYKTSFIALIVTSLLVLISRNTFAQVELDTIVVNASRLRTPDVVGPRVRETTAGPVQGYRALSSASATKTDTPLQQIPQSIQVIPRELIQDQQSLSVTEALQNASGTAGPSTLGSGQNGC